MNTCNYCGRENAEDATFCAGCGTSLLPEGAAEPSPQRIAARIRVPSSPERQMLYGGIVCVAGIVVTGVTYLAASGPGGGTYLVAWGAILFGGLRFFRGLTGKNPTPRVEDTGYDSLSEANRLETRGRIEEAMAAYQKIVETHPNTDAGHDAQKSLESLTARRG
jgi:hypothetical protein